MSNCLRAAGAVVKDVREVNGGEEGVVERRLLSRDLRRRLIHDDVACCWLQQERFIGLS